MVDFLNRLLFYMQNFMLMMMNYYLTLLSIDRLLVHFSIILSLDLESISYANLCIIQESLIGVGCYKTSSLLFKKVMLIMACIIHFFSIALNVFYYSNYQTITNLSIAMVFCFFFAKILYLRVQKIECCV